MNTATNNTASTIATLTAVRNEAGRWFAQVAARVGTLDPAVTNESRARKQLGSAYTEMLKAQAALDAAMGTAA